MSTDVGTAFSQLIAETEAQTNTNTIIQLGRALFEIVDRFDPQEIGEWEKLSEHDQRFYSESAQAFVFAIDALLGAPTRTKYSGALNHKNN